jgi:ABC-type sugar transport system permease subunit
MYDTAFFRNEPGYGCALAVALLVITLAVAIPVMRLLHGKREH